MPSSHATPLIGIDLGGTKIEIIALAPSGETLHRTRIPTPKAENPTHQYQAIITAIKTLILDCENTIQHTHLPVGIGIPGAISPKTGLIKNANTTCLIGKDFKQDLELALQRNVKIENDANCFALSEAVDGAGKAGRSVFGVILGTGVGGGIVINKHVHIGANAIGGEWGHNPLPWPNDADQPAQACYCGKKGCIETYLSGPGMSIQAQQEINRKVTSHSIFESRHQESEFQLVYEKYIDRLARSLASVINIMDPEIIVLGGGLSNVDSIYQDVPAIWEQYAFTDGLNTLLLKNQYGDSSGVRGAAWLNRPQ